MRSRPDYGIHTANVHLAFGYDLSHCPHGACRGKRCWQSEWVAVVQVKDQEYFPADLVLLSSTNPEGVSYIETMNLDGETNLKMKKALKETWDLSSPVSALQVKIEIAASCRW